MKETKTANKKRPWETSDIVREVPGKATSHSKRYVMGDGTEKEVFTFEPMHYYDEKKKQWCEIDNTLEEREDGYTASLGKYKAKVSRNDDNEAIEVKGEDGEGNISWEYLGTTDPRYNHARKPKKHRGGMRVRRTDDVEGSNGNRVIYENVEGGVDIEYGLSASGVKENIIIKEKSKRYKYFFKLYVKDFTMQLSEDGKSVEFYKKSDEERKVPEFIMPAPFMYDATGEVCREVYYDFEPVTKDNEDEYLFAVTANEDWINSENRTFPITVDPQLNKTYSWKNMMSYYSKKVYTGSKTDSSGNSISIEPEIMRQHLRISKDVGYESRAYINIYPQNAKFDLDNLMSAKLVITSINASKINTLYVNGKKASSDTNVLEIDIKEAFYGGNTEFELSTNTMNNHYIFYDFDIPPRIEVTYAPSTFKKETFHTLSLIPGVDVKYNIYSSESIPVFTSVSDPKLGIDISHIDRSGADIYHCGKDFRLNLDEKLEKIATESGEEKYQYTDALGYKHLFKERFYYFDSENNRIEIPDNEVDKLTVDLDGVIWYNSCIAKRELYTIDGLVATSKLENIKNVEWLEQRNEDEKHLEESLENYKNILTDYKIVCYESMEDFNGIESIEEYKKAIDDVKENHRILLPYADATACVSGNLSLNEISDSRKALKTQFECILENAKMTYKQLELQEKSMKANDVNLRVQYLNLLENQDIDSDSDIDGPIQETDYESRRTRARLSSYTHQLKLLGKYNDTKDTVDFINLYDISKDPFIDLSCTEYSTQFALNKQQLDLLKVQKESYPDGICDVDASNIYDVKWDDINDRCYGAGKNLARQIYDIRFQLNALNNREEVLKYQQDLYKKKGEEHFKIIDKYYKEYLRIQNELKNLRLQMPVVYLVSENMIKGYNERGELVVISDKQGNYRAVGREYCNSDTESRIAFISDKNGNSINFVYDGTQRLIAITNSIGQRTYYEYNTENYLSRVVFGDNKWLEFIREENKLTVKSSDGFESDITYNKNLLTKVCRSSSLSEICYNTVEKNRAEISFVNISTTDEIVSVNGRDNVIRKVIFEDDTGKQCIYLLDSDNAYTYFEVINDLVSYSEKRDEKAYSYIKKYIAKENCLNKYTFEEFLKDNCYDETAIELNNFNKPVRITEPYHYNNATLRMVGKKVSDYTYDENQKVLGIRTEIRKEIEKTDIDEVCVERYSYNALGNIVRKESFIEGEELKSGINIEEYVYDENGVNTKSFTYNSLDSSSKFYIENVLDKSGVKIGEFDQTGRAKTIYEYDAFGNIVSEILPNGSRYAYGRDASGNITAITHSTEDGEENTTQKMYRNGVATEVKSGNNKTRYSYDAERRIKSVDLNDKIGYVSYVYSVDNDSNDVVTATMANGVKIASTSDKRGNTLKVETNDNGNKKTVTNTYNSRNQLDSVIDSVSGAANYTYNEETGVILKVESADGVTESYAYNDEGKLCEKSVVSANKTRTYSYIYGNETVAKPIKSISVEDITITPELDANGRNIGKTISVPGNEKTIKIAEEQIAYLKFGDRATILPSTVRYGNNVNGKYVVRDSVKYRYDTMGNIVEVLENGLSVARYEYDALGRLKREDNKHFAKTTLFSYDDNGNILAKYEYGFTNVDTNELNTAEPTRTVLYGYDEDSDRLLTIEDSSKETVETFEYDEIGNPTTYRGKSATWSHGREMTSFDGNTFTYDARGRRVSKNGITFTYDSNGKLIKQSNGLDFVYDHTGLLAVEYNGSRYFYRKNAQNDIIALLDNDGNVVVKYVYDAWGVCDTIVLDENAANIANLNPFRYRSYYLDIGLNLYYLKTRYYDPEICRFITIDDLDYLDADSINGLNLYAYCLNNPIVYYDQSGNFWDYVFDAVFITLGIRDFTDDPSWSKGLFLAADIVLAIIPVIPAISSVRHLNKAEDVIDLTRTFGHIDNFADAGGVIRRANKVDFVDNGWDLVSGLNRTEDGFTISNKLIGTKIHTKFMNGGREINKFNRVDGIDDGLKIIYELKPYNKRSIRKGIKQLYRYQEAALEKYKSLYRMVLVLY